jgi:UDP-glucose 6-dehydrogenase
LWFVLALSRLQAIIAFHCPKIRVIVADINKRQIEKWNSADLSLLPIYEPGLDKVVEAVRGKNLFFSDDVDEAIRESEMIFVSVNTPTKTHGVGAGRAANLKNWELAARNISKVANGPKIVIEKSTLPVRTAHSMKRVLEANERGLKFEILSNPEFLAEGTAVSDLTKPDRVLIGGQVLTDSGKAAVEKLVWVYKHWVPVDQIITTNLWSSELSKLTANAFLAQRISSINSISALCETTGADVHEVARAMGMDKRIGKSFLNASVGFGGSVSLRSRNSAARLELVSLFLTVSYLLLSSLSVLPKRYPQPGVPVRVVRLARGCRVLEPSRPDERVAEEALRSQDDREDVQHDLGQEDRDLRIRVQEGHRRHARVGRHLHLELPAAGASDPLDLRPEGGTGADQVRLRRVQGQPETHRGRRSREVVRVHRADVLACSLASSSSSSQVLDEGQTFENCVQFAADPYEAAAGSHAIAIMTEWDEFKTLDYERMYKSMAKPAFVFDGRNVVDHKKLMSYGFEVYAIGVSGSRDNVDP